MPINYLFFIIIIQFLNDLYKIYLMEAPINKKLVMVGDGAVGKTCLMIRYTKSEYNCQYDPTTQVTFGGKTATLNMFDTAGQEEYKFLRPLVYPNTDIFLIAFSVVDPSSFINAKKKWYYEVKTAVPSAKVLFVGTKSDLRSQQYVSDIKNRQLTHAQIQKNLQSELKCHHLECSAITGDGVNQVFNEAAKMVLENQGSLKQNNQSLNSSRPAPNGKTKANEKQDAPQSGPCYCVLI